MKTPDELQTDIKQVIKERSEYITNDCFVFILLRLTDNKKYHQYYKAGGNFLMTVGLFSAINFIAKIYRYLIEDSDFITELDFEEMKKVFNKKWRSDIKSSLNKKYQNYFEKCLKIPPVGSVKNEQVCFVRLIKDYCKENKVDLGLSDDDSINSVWKYFRNALSHMSFPGGQIGTYDTDLTKIDREKIKKIILQQPRKAFGKEKGMYICNPDRLTIEIESIVTWLNKKIDSITDIKRLEGLKDWIERKI